MSEVQQDARYWMLVGGAARVTQALAPLVAHFRFIQSVKESVNPVLMIKHLGGIQAQRFRSNQMDRL